MKKYHKIEKKKDWDEYIIRGKGGIIGQLAKGDIFKKRVVFYPEHQTEWTSECLRQLADKLDELESSQLSTLGEK